MKQICLLFSFKTKNHSLLFALIDSHSLYHSLSFFVTRCITCCHSLSLVFTRNCLLPLVAIRCESLSLIAIRCRQMYLIVICCHSSFHSLSLAVTRCTTRLSFHKRSNRSRNNSAHKHFMLFTLKLSLMEKLKPKTGNTFFNILDISTSYANSIYLFKVNSKGGEQCKRRQSAVFTGSFQRTLHHLVLYVLLTLTS